MVDSTNPMNLAMPPKLGPEDKAIKARVSGTEMARGILASAIPGAPAVTGEGVPDPLDTIKANDAAVVARQELVDGTSFIRQAQAAASTQTFLMAAARNNRVEELAGKPDPSFKVDTKLLSNMKEDDQDFLLKAVNQQDFERRQMELADWRAEEEVLMRKGAGTALLAGFMAGLPEGVASGAAVAKGFQVAGVGARILAAQGKRGAAIAASVAENVGGNLAMTGAQDYIDTHVGGSDYIMGATFGIFGSGLEGRSLMEAANIADVRRGLIDAQNAAAERAYTLHSKAEQNLGVGATPEEVKAEAGRIEAQEIREVLNPGAELPPERHILPMEEEKLRPDVPEKAPAEGQDGTAKAPEEAAPVVVPPKAPEAPAPTYTLPPELAGAKPKWKTFDVNFASDVDKALFITSQTKKSKADGQYRDWLKSQGLTDEDINVYGKKIRENIKAAEKANASLDEPIEAPKSWESKTYPSTSLATHASELRSRLNQAPSEMSPLKDGYAYPEAIQHSITNKDSPQSAAMVSGSTAGWFKDGSELFTQPAGLHVNPNMAKNPDAKSVIATVKALMKMLPPGSRVFLSDARIKPAGEKGERGAVYSIGNTHAISVNPTEHGWATMQRTVIHEVGHAIWHSHAQKIPAAMRASIEKGFLRFVHELRTTDPDALSRRFSITSPDAQRLGAGNGLGMSKYGIKFDEYTAEQFVKWIEKQVTLGNKELSFPAKVMADIKLLVKAAVGYFVRINRGDLGVKLQETGEGMDEFFDAVIKGELKSNISPANQNIGLDSPVAFSTPLQDSTGISLMPMESDAQKAEVAAVTSIWEKARRLAPVVDEARLSKLMNTSIFQGAQSAANTMLRSVNPVVRWVASEILESPGGAGGRRSTAAIAKYINERAYLGNSLNDVQMHYDTFRKNQGQTIIGDFTDGRTWQRFNRMVADEVESRKPGATPVSSPAEVKAAADSLEAAYERMRVAQTTAKTIGWASLPETSVGYMPHKLSPEKVLNMSLEQKKALHSALTDQFIRIEGWDMSFADNLASRYIDVVHRRAMGGFDVPVGAHQVGAADAVEDALRQMGMTKPQITAMMKKYLAGAPGYTKRRLRLDLSAKYEMPDGTAWSLMDLFETDQFKLLRSQAARVSGETALARHGIMGKAHLALVREAMTRGGDGERATARELQAFDQICAEFLGEPFGTHNKMVDRAMQANSLIRLGGMGFTQLAETLNGIVSVGAAKTMTAVGSIARLRSEILDLAAGKTVDNPLLASLEKMSGAEFGTDAYKIVFPFDNGTLQHQTYGSDTITMGDRLLRGGSHLQSKLSFWRAIHSAQQRGFAEQIVRKSMEFIQQGKDMDVHLKDMGISPELAEKIRAELPNIATFNGAAIDRLDMTKMTDTAAADEFVQAVHRGVNQIIQGTFVGENTAWSHDAIGRIMTQFRTFSITSIEKQWARQRGNVGTAQSLGIIMGAMSLAAPLYMVRTYLSSIGRTNQQEYLDKQLSPYRITRATMNYVAASGLSGDLLDAMTAITGAETQFGGQGGSAASKSFVGNMVAPALGTVDDAWKALQNTKDGTDPSGLLRVLPGSKIPWIAPAINALGD